MIKTAILTISSTRTKSNDISGQVLYKLLPKNQFEIFAYDIVKDEITQIKNKLIHYSEELNIELILTSGGTGLGPKDITPEATLQVIDRNIPGFSELIRLKGMKKTNTACLSRGISGIKGKTIIINLPGSPKGVKESFNIIKNIIPHAVHMLKGRGH